MNTLFQNDRIRRILSDLHSLMYRHPHPITNVTMTKGQYDNPSQAKEASDTAVPFLLHDRWGGRNSYCWFHADVPLPDSHTGTDLVLRLSTTEYQLADTALLSSFVTAPAGQWDLMNPQFMLFINGSLRQGMDLHHTEALLDSRDTAAGHITLDFQAYAGLTDAYYNFIPELLTVDICIRDLYYDMLTVFEAALTMAEESAKRFRLLSCLNDTINHLDMKLSGTREFHGCVESATRFLRETAYTEEQDDTTAISITCVGHTHIDMAWLWDLKQTRLKAQRSFSTVLTMMEHFPNYQFMHTSPQLYAYLKQDNPELYGKIKEKIAEGRWEPEGAMWIEADCNIPNGESLVRQILYGKKFIKEEFDRDSQILWLPDVFGYSAALPQILNKSGITCFVTSKISWNMLNTMPYDTFLWKGIDGGEILTYFLTTPELNQPAGNCGATYNAILHPEAVYGTWRQYKQKDINTDLLMCYGYGDGGGGPTLDMLEKLKRLEKGICGFPRVSSGQLQPFFTRLKKLADNPRLPRWTGELYLELHQGTYTSNGEIKWNNRHAEHLLLYAEFLDNVCSLLGEDPHTELLNANWQLLLLNQFHDILPGSCIKEVYDESRKQFDGMFTQLHSLLADSMHRIAEHVHIRHNGFLIFNPGPFVSRHLFTLPCSKEWANLHTDSDIEASGLRFYDVQGNPITCQISSDREILMDAGPIEGHGYTALYLDAGCGCNAVSKPEYSDSITRHHMENSFYSLDLDDNGELSSLTDKIANRQVLSENKTGNCLLAYDDRPLKWDSWNIDMYYEENPQPVRDLVSCEVTEYGPLRYGIKQVKRYHRSTITQTIYLYRDIPCIDFVTDVDWQEDSTLLKAAFPVNINSDFATYDIQFGNVRRPTHTNTSWDIAKYEVCAHKWADLSEGNYGISLLNDCKYGYSIRDGILSITLLKAGMAPDPTIDRGLHHFTYSLFTHRGNCYSGGTIQEAFRLNHPLISVPVVPHAGSLPEQNVLFRCPDENIVIETFKRSEDAAAYILRMYETCNALTETSLQSAFPLSAVEECDLMEHPIRKIPITTPNQFTFRIAPFEIKTFKLYSKTS